MKCPYIFPSSTYTTQDYYGYDADGKCTVHIHMSDEKSPMMDCLREACAAWQDGKCRYQGG